MAIEKLLGKRHVARGIAILPFNDAKAYLRQKEHNRIFPVANSKIDYFYGAKNNLPDMDSCKAAFEAREMCKSLKETDILLTLISGGGSALLSLPSDISLSGVEIHEKNLELKQATIKALVTAGNRRHVIESS